jgi:hypothetical protein
MRWQWISHFESFLVRFPKMREKSCECMALGLLQAFLGYALILTVKMTSQTPVGIGVRLNSCERASAAAEFWHARKERGAPCSRIKSL